MAKSARASSRKANNQRLKKNVFGPVEAARAERLSAKLQELVAKEKPQKESDIKMIEDAENGIHPNEGETQDVEALGDSKMEVDNTSRSTKSKGTGRVEKKKRGKSKIVFPKYTDRKGKKRS
ncbi:hypothetical protein SODALDRAFT_333440 [Sodiomyces alkalinus F11]|uniref:DUF2423 domain-containing protein n=1 Tax=Sodiomyces alkalinus (strain CBS 110278 / VKM F-3762 / F11) TaxID=1314773 RepID=A0A3N2PWC1_SODAK|nr:hypothetical protein SODALDRAFT_333440 [Sodiomyces alkalinus F11]ROT38813.1 hypothetical protein SODALDRAFT_333440 [Sodiomyces alkalinus F11]